jgi:hypothetical protein
MWASSLPPEHYQYLGWTGLRTAGHERIFKSMDDK